MKVTGIKLYYEKLALEVIASRSHWGVVSPPFLTGRSGVTHKFNFVAFDGQNNVVFDIYDRVTETDVIKTYVKKLDTGATAYLICVSEKMTEGAGRLASEYGLKVLRSRSIESAFSEREIVPIRSLR